MNVLILTPDRVGSTLLQRMITIYMQLHEYDRPVINLHELTNGIMKYYSPVFEREVLGRFENGQPGYFQSLEEITELLRGADHYKTSRLAHYHIVRRQDSIAQQVPFYEYLNENFYIIAARRQNLLEHALSWCIFSHSKRLNVYTHAEKVATFAQLYQDKITVDTQSLSKYLTAYKNYLAWVDNHFVVSRYFEYENHMPDLEKFILNLDIFHGPQRLTWKDTFDIDFHDWNRCHYLRSDISGLGRQLPQQLSLTYDAESEVKNYQLQSLDMRRANQQLSVQDQQFMSAHVPQYIKSYRHIQELVDKKILVTGVPIKLQTLMEKRLLIRNWTDCVDTYNAWVQENGIGEPYQDEQLHTAMLSESLQWHATGLLK